jgi:hypothetical protein
LIQKSLCLAVIFSPWMMAQTLDYVPDLTSPLSPPTAAVRVEAQQLEQPANLVCSYRVTNRSPKPIYSFNVGQTAKGAHELPAAPLHWNQPSPGATPAGWFAMMGQSAQGYSTGWQAKTSADFIQQGQSQIFSFDFPLTEDFHCRNVNWTVGVAAVFPPVEFSPTSLSIALSNLQLSPQNLLEGDVAIRNGGPNDAILNVGFMLGGGDHSYPDRLLLKARGPDGQIHNLTYAGGPPGIAGRVDPMTVPIPQRGAYTLHVQWRLPPGLAPNRYAFYVEFEGTPARDVNPDARGVNLFRFWLGKLTSNEIALDVR